MSDVGGVLTIGDRSDAGTTRTFDGILDEVRISTAPRSSAWIKASFRSQKTPDTYLTLSEEQVDITLEIIKRAFQLDGTPIASGSSLPSGTPVRYLLYINNPGGMVSDVSVEDVLDPLYLYSAGSIRFDNSVAPCAASTCTGAEEAAIFAAAAAGTVGTDAVNGDPVSFTGTTLSAGDGVAANARLDLAAARVWAIVFTVTVQ